MLSKKERDPEKFALSESAGIKISPFPSAGFRTRNEKQIKETAENFNNCGFINSPNRNRAANQTAVQPAFSAESPRGRSPSRMKASFHRRRQGRTADEAARGGSAARRLEKTQGRLHMELNDILEAVAAAGLTRRGFLKAAKAAAALGLLNDARAKTGVRPYVIL